jgi:hypothetical protein
MSTLKLVPWILIFAILTSPSPARAGQADAENATVLITGYMDVIAGCNFKSNAASALVERDCEHQSESTVERWPYTCAGVVVAQPNGTSLSLAVLTARHCVLPMRESQAGDTAMLIPEQQTIGVRFHDGDVGTFRGVATGLSRQDDVALIRVQAKHAHTAAQSEIAVADGEALFVVGHSHGRTWGKKSARSVNGLKATGIEDWVHTAMMECADCGAGDSGSGVWDSQWRLVGIFNAVTAQFGLFTSTQRITQLLQH